MQRLLFNWKLKFTALVLSLALWSHVRGEVNPWETATFRVPLKWTAPPRTIALNGDKIPAIVRVNLRAPRSRLRELKGFAPTNPLAPAGETTLSNGDVTATLDFALARRGEQDVPIKAESRFDDVEIIGVRPSDVIVQLDRAETRSFPIQAQDFSSRGYRIENMQLENQSAVVSGLSNALEKVVRVRARVRSGALKLNVRQRTAAPLEAIDAQGETVPNVRVESESVGVSAVLRERIIERRLPVSARLIGALQSETPEIQLRPSSLLVRGPELQIEKIQTLYCEVSLGELQTQTTLRRRVALPARVIAVNSAFVTLQVTCSVRCANSRHTNTIPDFDSKRNCDDFAHNSRHAAS